MAPKKKITMDEVGDAIYQLREDGEKVSARNILPITGGSNSTIIPLLAQFLDEEEQQEQFSKIGKNLMNALIAEIKTIVDKETKSIRNKVKSARALRDETINILEKCETQHEKDVKKRDQQVAAHQKKNQHLKDALAHAKGERDQQQRALDTFRQENASLQARVTELAEELAYLRGFAAQSEDHKQPTDAEPHPPSP